MLFCDWDGGVLLENNEPDDSCEIYTDLDEDFHTLVVWGYNYEKPVKIPIPI